MDIDSPRGTKRKADDADDARGPRRIKVLCRATTVLLDGSDLSI